MYIIGHRGAAGLAPENTLLAIEAARACRVDAIECDVQVTKDHRLVLCHDNTLLRITGKATKVSDLTLHQIATTVTNSGVPIPTLQEAFEAAGTIPLIIDGKGSGWAKALAKELKSHKSPLPKVISADHRELVIFSLLRPDVETYAVNDFKPFEAIYTARDMQLTGISVSFWFYNPLTYWFAKRAGLKMIMSPLNNTLLARLLHLLYPQAAITTDFPDRFAKRHHKKRRK
jgi:glycerophosphoryl diester phosphodiesterase